MTKKVRIGLYIVSLFISTIVLALLIFNEKILMPVYTQKTEQVVSEQISVEAREADPPEEEAEQNSIVYKNDNQTAGKTTTIVFAGDVLIKAAMEQRYDEEGIAGLVSEELLAEMRNADVCMVNNEFQFSTRGTPMEDKQFTFRTDPEYVQVMLDMGVDIVSLANNHSLDYGLEALEDTFNTLDNAGILYAGAGATEERAKALQVVEVNGLKFGFLAATRVIPISQWNVEYREPGLFTTYDDTGLIARIEAAQEECDFLTVYVHWGEEKEEYYQEYQTTIAQHCFEAGADLVIGAHPHVLQGIEFMDGKPVFYSLGNYIFAHSIEQTAMVKVEIWADGEAVYSLIPAYARGLKTQMLTGSKAENLFDYMNELSPNVFLDEKGNIYEIE